ncbi:cytochrome c1 [Candidatus Ichthyocystis hellenicum]|uniref:cytochrome c1 n=1 Tax=Candidatus Ichthyocystis hellenicum TaxID=1561003 RepID=UPI000A9FA154|nr:cytochrome c1 [Candidatus Ichthyocystis hellenicum]
MYSRIIVFFLAFIVPVVGFSEEDDVALDRVHVSLNPVNLQRGARTFVNYCLGCHSASGFRYAGFEKIGLKKEEILTYLGPDKESKDFLISSMYHPDAEKWFGVVPPDLSWIARSRGVDWIYTYLRSFYRDNDRPNGWNNVIFPSVNMPNVFHDLSGVRSVTFEEVRAVRDNLGNLSGYKRVIKTYPGDGSHKETVENLSDLNHLPSHRTIWGEYKGGVVSPVKYDNLITDLVSFLSYMAEPKLEERESIGFFFITWLLILSGLLYALKSDFWSDVD